jgi:hypothetical protein
MNEQESDSFDEADAWRQFSFDRLEQEWDNPADAIYDDWKQVYCDLTDEAANP